MCVAIPRFVSRHESEWIDRVRRGIGKAQARDKEQPGFYPNMDGAYKYALHLNQQLYHLPPTPPSRDTEFVLIELGSGFLSLC